MIKNKQTKSSQVKFNKQNIISLIISQFIVSYYMCLLWYIKCQESRSVLLHIQVCYYYYYN